MILSGVAPASGFYKWPVLTDRGVFDETELFPAHPSVIATAEGRDLSAEAFRASVVASVALETDDGLSFELRGKVEKALKKAAVDLNGHWRNGAAIGKGFKILEHVFLGRNAMSRKDAEDLVLALRAKTSLDRWVPVDAGIRMALRTCSFCGEEDFATETNGLVVRLVGDPCKFANGLPLTEWELNVPSGKLAVANDLRAVFPLPETEDFDINTRIGCRLTALEYAANGVAHAYVGNSCPDVYRCADGTFKIANPPSEEDWDESQEKFVPVTPTPVFDGEQVAGICTDLWWYSICDHAEFKRRCRRFKNKVTDFDIETVDVKPGVYRFRHDEDARGHDGPGERVYTRFEWIREPDPVQDFLASYEAVDVNSNAYVQAQVARWPTLYGKTEDRHAGKEKVVPWSDMTEEDRARSWRMVADQVFCTIGGGVEWHEKGFPKAKVDSSVPDVEPPSFRAQHHWYPFSRPYGGLFEPRTLAPSFAKLAFRVLESVISFGIVVRDGAKSRDVRYVRERMLVAVKRYRELAELYPDQADPEYVAWLAQKGRAEAWVKSFNLGPEFTKKHVEHAKKQRWVPEDAYAVMFDAENLQDGHFAWHPKKGGGWASKANAQRYALVEWSDNGQEGEHNCFWSSNATNTSVPLYFVARVTKVGEVSHMGETLVEVAFDYGTPWMQDVTKRKALVEMKEKAGIRVLTQEEYNQFLPRAVEFFETSEAQMENK